LYRVQESLLSSLIATLLQRCCDTERTVSVQAATVLGDVGAIDPGLVSSLHHSTKAASNQVFEIV
jgi:hypothetical protein